MVRLLWLFLLLLPLFLSAKETPVFRVDSLPEQGIPLNRSWKFMPGDNPAWAHPEYDDSEWDTISTQLNDPVHPFRNMGWFRLRVLFDSSAVLYPAGLRIRHPGASEIYVDGKKIRSFGIPSRKSEQEKIYVALDKSFAINISPGKIHLIAVRYSNTEKRNFPSDDLGQSIGFSLSAIDINHVTGETLWQSIVNSSIFVFLFCFFLLLGDLHLLIYIFHRTRISNLYFFIFSLFCTIFPLGLFINANIHDWDWIAFINSVIVASVAPLFASLHLLTYSLFHERMPRLPVYAAVASLVVSFTGVFIDVTGAALLGLVIFILLDVIRIIIIAVKTKKRGSGIIGTGLLMFVTLALCICIFIFVMLNTGQQRFVLNGGWGITLIVAFAFLSLISIPVSMSIYLAKDFAETSRNLEKKITEVERLSAQTITQEREKQQILESQKEMLEMQVRERTAQISEQKAVIEEKNKDITDSINYARGIQNAMLPPDDFRKKLFPGSFVLFIPRDIVSGDFYWFAEKNGIRYAAAVDCTGHGVPGALMSMVGNHALNTLVNEKGITVPSDILDQLHREVRKSLRQNDQAGSRDGMDIALCAFHPDRTLEYAGAHRPLWIVRKDGRLEEIQASKIAIGGMELENRGSFTGHRTPLQPGDGVYIFSDGFADQFGGPEGKKFMTRRFKELLLQLNNLPVDEQKQALEKSFRDWRGNTEQTDDVLVIGINP